MLCPKCGKSVPAEKEVCPICGANLKGKEKKKLTKKTWQMIAAAAAVVVVAAAIIIAVVVSNTTTSDTKAITRLIENVYTDSETFDHVEVVEDNVTIYLRAPEGTAASIAAGGDTVKQAWRDMTLGLCSATQAFESMLEEEGYEGYPVAICMLSDTNPDNQLLRVISGGVMYSALDLSTGDTQG